MRLQKLHAGIPKHLKNRNHLLGVPPILKGSARQAVCPFCYKAFYDKSTMNRHVAKRVCLGVAFQQASKQAEGKETQCAEQILKPDQAKGVKEIDKLALPYSNKTEELTYSNKTEELPYPNKTEELRYSKKTEVLPYSNKTEALPYSNKTEALPYSNKTEALPYPDKIEALPYPDKSEALPYPDKSDTLPPYSNKSEARPSYSDRNKGIVAESNKKKSILEPCPYCKKMLKGTRGIRKHLDFYGCPMYPSSKNK